MRKIKFRGKGRDGNWVYGQLVIDINETGIYTYILVNPYYIENYACIEADEIIEVDPETIGQFIGLHDVNKIEIYEKDIIDTGYDRWIVKFDNGSFYAMKPNTSSFLDLSREIINYYEIKVIGNIFDNPELIEN